MGTKDQSASMASNSDSGASVDVQLPNEPGATLPVPSGATAEAPSDKEVDKSAANVQKAAQAVLDAEAAVAKAKKSKEEQALDEARAKHGDAVAAHAELTGAASDAAAQPMTVAAAKVLAVVDPNTSAGDHVAQKFGNDPANPALAVGVDPTANLVKLSRQTPDLPKGTLAYTEVPEKMVGDYVRAGWNVA